MPSELAIGESVAADRRSAVAMAAEALLRARSTRSPLAALPDGAAPLDEAEAYAIQALVAGQLGPVAAWKVGAASATATPFYAPIHAATLWIDGDRLPATGST